MGTLKDIRFPMQLDGYGGVLGSEGGEVVEDLLAQIIFTSIGERVYRQSFGSNMMRFVYQPVNLPISVRRSEIANEVRNSVSRSERIDGEPRMRVSRVELGMEGDTTNVFVDAVDITGQAQNITLAVPSDGG